MKTKEENRGKEEELPMKKELLSDEELLEVAGGEPRSDAMKRGICLIECHAEGRSSQECDERCGVTISW